MKLLPLLGHFAPGYLQTENFGTIWMVFEQIWVKFGKVFPKIWGENSGKSNRTLYAAIHPASRNADRVLTGLAGKKKCPDKSPQIPSH